MIDFKKPLLKKFIDDILPHFKFKGEVKLKENHIQLFVIKTCKVILMEMWEYNLREKLERELDGSIYYQIGHPPYVAMTGKRGYIQFEVALHKEVRSFSTIEGEYFY